MYRKAHPHTITPGDPPGPGTLNVENQTTIIAIGTCGTLHPKGE